MAGPLGFELAGLTYAPGEVVPVWDHLQTQHIFAEVGQGRLEIRRYPAEVAHVKSQLEEDAARLAAIQGAIEKAEAEAEALSGALEALGAGLMGLADLIKGLPAGGSIGREIESLGAKATASGGSVKRSTRKRSRAEKAQS